MSTQLILYPQNYNGQYNFTSTSALNEFVVEGINFATLNTTSSHDSSTLSLDTEAITALSPLTVNSWYRLRYPASAPPALPVESGGNLVFNSIATSTYSGVFQRLSSLTIGQSYDVTVTLPALSVGTMRIRMFNGTLMQSQSVFSPTTLILTHTFTATAPDNTVMLLFSHAGVANVTVTSISVSPQASSPTLNYHDLQDGQVIVDLYENEDIPLTLSVDNFKNVAEKVQSYSKAFNLPGTKRNNQIFDNVFDITRSDDGIVFNPYVKTQCCLKQDGFILFQGYLRLLDIQEKKGETSYNINLYSEVIALADILKEMTFSDLDFTELSHNYNKTNIKYSWNDSPDPSIVYTNTGTSGFRDAYTTLRYPFIDWNHDFALGGSNATAATANRPELMNLQAAFRPCINVKYLIERIFNQAGFPFTYTSAFFDTNADFNKLYMDFNWGAENQPTTSAALSYECYYFYNVGDGSGAVYATDSSFTTLALCYNIPLIGGSTPPNYNDSTNILTSTVINEAYTVTYNYQIANLDSVDREVECRWLHNTTPINAMPPIGSAGVQVIPAGGTFVFVGVFSVVMGSAGETLKAEFRTDAGTASQVTQGQIVTGFSGSAIVSWVANIAAVSSNSILQSLRGETGQWDFLKGLMTMFNLVSIPDTSNPNNILIEPYADVFIDDTSSGTVSDLTLASRGIEHDWTDKIDIEEMKLLPLTDLNKRTIFKFAEDDDDYVFNVYKQAVFGHLYGSKIYDASGFTILQGDEEIVAEPFAATLSKPLMTQFPYLLTPAIYSYNVDDGTSEGFDNAPRILYNNGIKPSGTTYYIPEQNGVSNENQPDFLQFSHLSTVPTIVNSPPALTDTQDFHFGECQLTQGMGQATPKNLFNLYWLPYFNELYNPDTRIMTIKVNLTPGDVNIFKFFDTVFIKNRHYRVNKIDYKPGDLATVEFILIP
tara:strand:+ start:34 stop:2853 length:2820 start_codon:yes stop_codon:yes gene_type:complete